MTEDFVIATTDGAVFCKCNDNDGSPVLKNKDGKTLQVTDLLKQAYNPEVARKMRKQKGRKVPEPEAS